MLYKQVHFIVLHIYSLLIFAFPDISCIPNSVPLMEEDFLTGGLLASLRPVLTSMPPKSFCPQFPLPSKNNLGGGTQGCHALISTSTAHVSRHFPLH